MPRSRAVRDRAGGGVANHITATTTTISTSTDTRLCHRKIVCDSPMMPSGTTPWAATISRIRGCKAPGLAICSAAEPLRPCAQMLPRPSTLAAPSAR